MRRWELAALLGILALGVGLRLYGITAGLPGTALGDEQPVVHHAAGIEIAIRAQGELPGG